MARIYKAKDNVARFLYVCLAAEYPLSFIVFVAFAKVRTKHPAVLINFLNDLLRLVGGKQWMDRQALI